MSPGHYRRPNTAWTQDNSYATFWGAKKVYYGGCANGKFKFFLSYEFSRETAREKVKKAEDQNK